MAPKSKSSQNGTPQNGDRFACWDISARQSEPEKTGLLPSATEFQLGWASLERCETIRLFGSSSATNERLQLKLKWRPSEDEPALVSLVSELEFSTASGRLLRYEQVESYQPGAKLAGQYGSSASRLKLLVASPYRRMRLVFNGPMQEVGSAEPQGTQRPFVRLACVLTPCGQIFDFLANSTKFHATGRPNKRRQAAELEHHDRHEQKVRFDGEICFADQQERHAFTLRGFYARHLSEPTKRLDANYRTRRLYVYLQNGKSFQLGASKGRSHVQNGAAQAAEEAGGECELRFGYTHFTLLPYCESMRLLPPRTFDLLASKQKLLASASERALEVYGSQQGGERMSFRLSEESQQPNWFKVVAEQEVPKGGGGDDEGDKGATKLAETPGWALWTEDDELVDGPEVVRAIAESRNERRLAIELGELLPEEPGRGSPGLAPEEANDVGQLVVSIDELCCTSSDLVGAKAASLAQLRRFSAALKRRHLPGFQVAPGCVLTRLSWQMLREQNKSSIDERLGACTRALLSDRADGNSESACRAKCLELQRLVERELELPAEIREQLLAKLFTGGQAAEGVFAVRSSSWGEDEGDMSAAGQLTTVLNVRCAPNEADSVDRLCRAVMVCFGSKFSYENLHYKRQHALPLDLPMAVVVQRMVACNKAGVLFTCDPLSGHDGRLLITANYGLGESVVSAAADPDSIVVKVEPRGAAGCANGCADLSIEHIKVGKKELVIESAAGKAMGTDEASRARCCLSEQEILRLAQVACSLRRLYSARQANCDIEFGYLAAADGAADEDELYLFQCRPVTALEAPSEQELLHEFDRPGPEEFIFYSRANVGEVMPYAIRPLTNTLILGQWCVLEAQMKLEHQAPLGKNKLRVEQIYSPQFSSSEMRVEKCHCFFNLFGGTFLRLGEENRSTVGRSLEVGIFGHELELQHDLIEALRCFKPLPGFLDGPMFRLKTARMRLEPARVIGRADKRVERLYRRMMDQQAKQMEENLTFDRLASERERVERLLERYNQLKGLLSKQFEYWRNHMSASIIDSELLMELNELLANYLDDPIKLSMVANKLLAHTPGVVSAEIPARIGAIAQAIRRDEAVALADGQKPFVELDNEEALTRLRQRADFNQFIERFGHRCYNEFDISAPTWREQPAQLVALIRGNCHAALQQAADAQPPPPPPPEANDTERLLESLELELKAETGARLGKLHRLKLKHFLVPRCRLFLASRERTKNAIIMFLGCLRLATRQLARELRLQLRLPDEQLLYFLPFDQLEPLCRDFQPALVLQAQRRRQLFSRLFPDQREVWKFDEIIRGFEVRPQHEQQQQAESLSVELDKLNAPKLLGTPASSGKARGRVCLVRHYADLERVRPGNILVTHSTDIAFSPAFPLVAGIVTEVGGLISHGAVVAREYGLPSVIGVANVTRLLADGELILLDADAGTIRRLDNQSD